MQFNDEEETKVHTVFEGLSDEEIANNAKLDSRIKKVVNSLPMPQKHRELVSEIIIQLANELVDDKLKRFGERLGTLEESRKDDKHEREMKDKDQDGVMEKLEERLEGKVQSAIYVVSVVGFFVVVAATIIAAVL